MVLARTNYDEEGTEIDVTGRAAEETASLISFILKECFSDEDG
jgi:hypothetical protein